MLKLSDYWWAILNRAAREKPMNRWFTSSMVTKTVAMTLTMIAVSIAVVSVAIDYRLDENIVHESDGDAREASRVMALLYEVAHEGVSTTISDGLLTDIRAEAMPAITDHALVDRVAAAIGGVATIFEKKGAEFVRVSTNVKTENGERAIGTTLAADHPGQAMLARGEPFFGTAVLFGRDYMTGYFPIKNPAGATIGIQFIGFPMEVYFAKVHAVQSLTVMAGLATLAVVGLVAFFVVSRSMRPMPILIRAVRDVSEGRLDAEIPYQDRSDEYGQIARALTVFRQNAKARLAAEAESERNRAEADAERSRGDASRRETDRQIDDAVTALAQGLGAMARGDLSKTIDRPLAGRLEQLRIDFNASLHRLRATLGQVRKSASEIHAGSQELLNSSDTMSKRTERQAAAVEETAAALHEITTTVRGSTTRAEEAHQLVSRTRRNAEQSGDLVQRAVEAMHGIDESSKKISSIISVIDEIAFQTNLLALNAGVEAARAGEAGRGFAVVAQEVRGLAQRSADAAREIKSLIMASADEVENGVGLVGETGQALHAIVSEVKEISEHVDAIVQSAREQNTSLTEVNTAVGSIDQGTQQNAAMAEETAAASHGLARQADVLAELLSGFSLGEGAGGDVAAHTGGLRAAAERMRDGGRAPARRSA
jgi:methyl-accepting chemotaxis protein